MTSKYIFHYRNFVINLLIALVFTNCTKFVQIDPPKNQLTTQNVFSNDASASSAILGIYAKMSSSNGFAGGGKSSVTQLAGLSSDEFINYSANTNNIEFFNNNLSISNGLVQGLWSEPYQYIYASNAVMEGLNASSGVSANTRKQIEGEARFLRAFCYFYLTNLYGDLPIDTTSDYQANSTRQRSSADSVHNFIINDLKIAKTLLSPDYSFSSGERIRPNDATASSLLARVYLYRQQWDSAESVSTSVIENSLYKLISLDSVFLKNSGEAILQLQPVLPNINTQEGNFFILTAPPTVLALSDFITSAFETGDNRRNQWIGSFSNGVSTWYFPYKYKVKASPVITEYSMVLRIAEQYLIRAEARAHLNKVSMAQEDLNTIRNRAGLAETTATDQSSLYLAIEHERQVELFSEWGHRWLDLNRTNRSDIVLAAEKPSWTPDSKLYPVPLSEIQNNKNISQNPGY